MENTDTITISETQRLKAIQTIFRLGNATDSEITERLAGVKLDILAKVLPVTNHAMFKLGHYAASVDEVIELIRILQKGRLPLYQFWLGVSYYLLMREKENLEKEHAN